MPEENTAPYAYPPDLARFVLDRWAAVHDQATPASPPPFAILKHFLSARETTPDDQLATRDEALFETAHLIAGLASPDGAV